jgi:inner membrane protease subunit 1
MMRETFMVVPSLALYYLFTEHVVSVNKAEGRSMEPTVSDNSLLLVNRLPRSWRGIVKNDIVIARSPYKTDLDICKRVKYLAGERVVGYDLVVPPNYVWVEGDNTEESFDSRHYGPIPIQLVFGRVERVLL